METDRTRVFVQRRKTIRFRICERRWRRRKQVAYRRRLEEMRDRIRGCIAPAGDTASYRTRPPIPWKRHL